MIVGANLQGTRHDNCGAETVRCKRNREERPRACLYCAGETFQLRVFAISLWKLGLSYRANSLIWSGMQVFVSHMMIWRDVQAEVQVGGQSSPAIAGNHSAGVALNTGRNSLPLDFLPLKGSKPLDALWKQLPGRCSKPDQALSVLKQLRDLLLRLSQDWQNYCTFQSEPLIPWTYNAIEQTICRVKMRARTVHDFRS